MSMALQIQIAMNLPLIHITAILVSILRKIINVNINQIHGSAPEQAGLAAWHPIRARRFQAFLLGLLDLWRFLVAATNQKGEKD
jgi:hypothetical protein